jgi:hypothetical protein
MTETKTIENFRANKIADIIREKISTKNREEFALYAKKQLKSQKNIENLFNPEEIIREIGVIFSGKVIPVGLSLNRILDEFHTWNKKSSGFKRLSSIDDEKVEEDTSINITATETGGMILKDIGSSLDPGRSVSATAINQLIDKLIPNERNSDAKLSGFKEILKNNLIDKETSNDFFLQAKKAQNKAAGMFVDFIEQARDDNDIVTTEAIVAVLEANKLYDSHDVEDRNREFLLLKLFADWANDIDLSDDDVWKELVMEALVNDYNTRPSTQFREMSLLDIPRSELNIMKSFQTMVANIMVPPPRRGRPPKSK